MTAFIEGAQWQKAYFTSDLAARKISVYGSIAVEREAQLSYTECHVWDASTRLLGSHKTQLSSTF